jgi:hypothetical protein
VNIPEAECREKYKGSIEPVMYGALCNLIAKVKFSHILTITYVGNDMYVKQCHHRVLLLIHSILHCITRVLCFHLFVQFVRNRFRWWSVHTA